MRQYNRTVGGRTIAAYLQREGGQTAREASISATTIWRILRRRQYILVPHQHDKQPFVRPEPGSHWEIDFCTAARRSPDAPDKKENALEVFSVVDRGSSATMDSQASATFDAEQALLSIASTLVKQRIPRAITVDRDPRLVGSQATMAFHQPLPDFYCAWAVKSIFCHPIGPI